MSGERLEKYWAAEMQAVIDKYRQFEILIPSTYTKGAGHRAEDGRYVESLLKSTLKKFLPGGLEIFSGFILKVGAKSWDANSKKYVVEDKHSTQLDMIVYDKECAPVYQVFADTAVVPPEGVIAVISIKKRLYASDLKPEFTALKNVAELCAQSGKKGPFLGLVGMEYQYMNPQRAFTRVATCIEEVQDKKCISYEELPGFVGALKDRLSLVETDTLALGVYTMTVELAVRFLTDYLSGDTYFSTNYPGHNLDRAKCQLALAESIYSNLDKMQKIIREYAY